MVAYLPPGITTSDIGGVSGTGADNRIPTFTDATNIQGEANLTFDGSTLTVTGDAVVTDDLTLNTDSAVFNMGAGNDFTITHDGTTGATIAGNPITITSAGAATWSTSSGALTITSAAAATWSTAAGVLTIDGDDGIVLNTGGSGNVIVSEAMSVGATTAPDGTLHVHAGSAGSVTANSLADDLVVENSATGGISILVPDNANALLNFGSASDNYGAQIYWDYDGSKLVVGTANAGDKIIFQTADGTESAHLSGGATPTFQFQGATTLSTSTGALTIDGDDGIVLNTGGSGDLQVNENILVGANTDGYDVKFFGNASGSYMLWDESEDDLIVIGNVGIGVAPSTGVLEIQRGSNAFSTAAAATDVDNIFLKSNVTQGDGVYGPSIAWARVSDSQRRKLAIVAKQDGADDDDVGMAIFTNPGPGASAMVERLEIGGDGQFDFKSNALGITNVGASGNDWTQNALTLAGGSAAQTMSVVTTGSSANVRLDLKIPASGTGYPEVRFIQGSGNGDDDNQMFKISYVSDPGYLRMRSENTDGSSTGADIWRVPDGQLTIDANTTWDTNVFDAYDDAAVLSPYREGRFNLTQRKQELIDMGILKEYDDGFIGYNEQRMAALLAGGIYQNRDRMDSQYDEIGKRLAKIEQALGV